MKLPLHAKWRLDLHFKIEKDKDNYSGTFAVNACIYMAQKDSSVNLCLHISFREKHLEGFSGKLNLTQRDLPTFIDSIQHAQSYWKRSCHVYSQKVLGRWQIFVVLAFCNPVHGIWNKTQARSFKPRHADLFSRGCTFGPAAYIKSMSSRHLFNVIL